MKRFAKGLTAAALSLACICPSVGAITAEGENETWFDSVWEVVQDYSLIAEHDHNILQNYINLYLERHPEELNQVLNDILSVIDAHSMYLSAETYSENFSTLEGYVGVGVGLRDSEQGMVVDEVMPYSSAQEAGIQVGDVLVGIDGQSVEGQDVTQAAQRLRGEPDTTVVLTVRRQGEELSFTCTRQTVNQVYVTGTTVSEGVEYIGITAFGSENDWAAFEEIWQGLDEKNTRAVILDLRGNGGGVVEVAMKIADTMTEQKGTLLASTRWREDEGGLEPTFAQGGGLPLNKIVVLVDGNTASAAELLAGSLRDNGLATLVGEQTYGKGQGQYHLGLPNGDKLVLTCLEFELPKTGVYEGVGLTPDEKVENPMKTVDIASMRPLDTTQPIYYGQTGAQVAALTERMQILGAISEVREIFDAKVLQGLLRVYQGYELPACLYASSELLAAMEADFQAFDGVEYYVDEQLNRAIMIAQLAAKQPQRYRALEDGSWQAIAS